MRYILPSDLAEARRKRNRALLVAVLAVAGLVSSCWLLVDILSAS